MTPASIAVNRFGLGARPDDRVGADARAWLLAQLARYQPRPATVAPTPTTRAAAEVVAAYGDDRRDLRQRYGGRGTAADAGQAVDQVKVDAYTAGLASARTNFARQARDLYEAAVGARVATALSTETPFVERLVYFWSNHFALAAKKPQLRSLAGSYEVEAIRPHVLGRFRDLLGAAERHPAMLIYLDAAKSVGPDSPTALRRTPGKLGLNENLAREIMELHTLGVRTGYTQADVTEFARALTGWTAPGLVNGVRDGTLGEFGFEASRHQPGARTIMGRTYRDTGVRQAEAVLDDLAASPATARHIATKLTRHFAGAPEPAAMVDRLAAAFLRSDGDLPTVYRALIVSPEAWVPRPVRFRTPWDWSIAALRATGTRAVAGHAAVGMLSQLGQPTWQPLQPSGWDDDDAAWLAADGLMRRVEEAERLAAGMTDPIDARALAERLYPDAVSPATAQGLARADSPAQALALLYCCPEMMRR